MCQIIKALPKKKEIYMVKGYYYDVIYGNIFIPDKFLALINAKEVLRLSQITQLGFSFLKIPQLFLEERLSHSIGSYYLTTLMIDKLKELCEKKGIYVPEYKTDIARCAMLLHDVGHGPFSHAFEKVTGYSHEKLTRDIILGDTELNKRIVENFGEDAPFQIAGFIANVSNSNSIELQDNFTKLFKSLISHQIDADRLDYLVRDSYYAGIKTAIDHQKIICALSLCLNENGEYELLIDQNYVSLFETVIVERYQKYRDVYFENNSEMMDVIFPLIIERCRKNYAKLELEGYLKDKKSTIKKLIKEPKKLRMEEIIEITEQDIISMLTDFLVYQKDKDPLVSELANLDNLSSYQVIENMHIADKIKEGIKEICPDIPSVKIDNVKSIFESSPMTRMYKETEGLKVDCVTRIVDISEVSELIQTNINIEASKTIIMEKPLIKELGIPEEKEIDFSTKLKKLISKLLRKEEEFELKYFLSDEVYMQDIIMALCNSDFVLSGLSKKKNEDFYYDTKELTLLQKGISLRTRYAKEKEREYYKFSYNQPLAQGSLYSSRMKIEGKMDSMMLSKIKEKLSIKNISIDVSEIMDQPVLLVNNARTDLEFEGFGAKVCVSFDSATYSNLINLKSVSGSMIEIEAIGNFNERIILNKIHDILSNKFKDKITITSNSKYETGMHSTM